MIRISERYLTPLLRNSKLTKLMQHYLVGNAATSIIVAIGNDPDFREETKESEFENKIQIFEFDFS